MNFLVSKSLKGSFVSSTLNKALQKGSTISISGNDLYAPDIKTAIKQGVLIPLEEYSEEIASLSDDAMIVNRTDRVIVLGKVVLRPWQLLLVSKNTAQNSSILSAEQKGFISVVSDEKRYGKKTVIKEPIEKLDDTKKSSEKIEKNIIDNDDAEEKFVAGADRKVKPKVWNFREQEAEDAQFVPKTEDVINVDEEIEEDKTKTKKKATKKKINNKKTTKKTTPKKATSKKTIKKKEITSQKKKHKVLKPIGDKRIPKTEIDAIIELDSRGNPINKASDTLEHLIDSIDLEGEVSFVDQE
jgi:hypothetical protein